MAATVKTIQDLETLYYSKKGAAWIQKNDVTKADAPVLSTTTGVYNAVYGAQVWIQLNSEANAFGALPKEVWTHSGWRVITTAAATDGTGGVAENGAIPDTTKPTFAEVSTKPKTVAHSFDVTEVQEILAQSEDDAIGNIEFLRNYFGIRHKEHINKMLLGDVDTLASDNFESIDRVVSSYDELTNLSLTAGDSDIYGIDRDAAASWADAYVDDNSGTDRSLTDDLVLALIQNIGTNGGNTTFNLTGHDSLRVLINQFSSQIRYNVLGEATASVGVNGIQTEDGVNAGFRIASLYGIPVLKSHNVFQDTISRFYALDTSDPEGFGKPRLSFRVAKPTQYFETGMNQGNPFAINKFSNEGVYRTVGELICRFFKAQGKIRDLKT